MPAMDHPEYAIEAAYLRRTLRAVERRIEFLANLGWSGGGNPRATVVIGELFNQQAARMRDMLREPYVGRVDRSSDGRAVDVYYVGRAGLQDPESRDRLVVDWRAEVARPLFRPDSQTRLRRRFVIERCQLAEIYDDRRVLPAAGHTTEPLDSNAEILADPALRRALADSRGQHLKDIVATIQEEQDELIRSTDQALIIQGGAGTGKTVVALHRLAYLLYRARNEIQPARDLRVCVFGPNRLFLNFISAILPSLGERGIQQTTFEDWFKSWCGVDAPQLQAWDEELERMLDPRVTREARLADYRRARLKGSLRMGDVLRRYVEQLRNEAVLELTSRPLTVTIKGGWRGDLSASLPESFLASVARSVAALPLNRARATIRTRCWERLVRDLDDVIPPTSQMRAPVRDAARRSFDAELDARWPSYQLEQVYRALLGDPAKLASVTSDLTSSERASLTVGVSLGLEDLAPLAYLRLLLDGVDIERDNHGRETGKPRRFDHIVVDEAQDFAPLQMCVLRAHTDGLTLVGNIAQGIHSYRGLASWTEAIEALDRMSPRLVILNRGYRSTRQITQFGNALLRKIKRADSVEPFPRDGAGVRLERVSDGGAVIGAAASRVAEALRKNAATVAVITKTAAHARQVYGALA